MGKSLKSFEGKMGLAVEVRNNNVDAAIKIFSRKVKQEGLLRELKERSFYEPPSVEKRRKKREAQARARKAAKEVI